MRSKLPRESLSLGKFPVFAYGHGDPELGGQLRGTLPEPALGWQVQHPLFHGGWGWWWRFQKRRRRRKKDCRRPQGLPLFLHSTPNPKLSASTKPQRERDREREVGVGRKRRRGESKKIAKVNGLELEAASATAVWLWFPYHNPELKIQAIICMASFWLEWAWVSLMHQHRGKPLGSVKWNVSLRTGSAWCRIPSKKKFHTFLSSESQDGSLLQGCRPRHSRPLSAGSGWKPPLFPSLSLAPPSTGVVWREGEGAEGPDGTSWLLPLLGPQTPGRPGLDAHSQSLSHEEDWNSLGTLLCSKN